MDTRDHLTTNLVAGALTSTHLTIRTLMPLLLAVLAQTYGFADGRLGDLGAAYSAGATLAAMTSMGWMRGARMQLPAIVLLSLGVGSIAAVLWVPNYAGLLLLFMLAGVGHGGLFALMIALLARTENPSRSYGWQWSLGSIPGVLLLYAAPALAAPGRAMLANFGLIVVANLLMGLSVLRLPARLAPLTGAPHTAHRHQRLGLSWPVLGSLFAVFALYSGITGGWAFLGRIASSMGLSGEYSGVVLAIATAASSVVSLLAGEIGNRGGRPLPMGAAILGMLISMALLALWTTPAGYAVGTVALIALSGFVLPFAIGIVARLDPSGRAAGLPAAALGIGAISGPSLAGHVYQAAGPSTMLLMAGLTILAGFAAYLLVFGRSRRRERDAHPADPAAT